MTFIKRVIVITLALVLAAFVMRNMSGFEITKNGWIHYAVMAVILAILNASLTPLIKTMTCGMIILTLGLFSLVINAFVFWLASYISTHLLGGGFAITKFWPALVGSLIVSFADMILVGNRKKSKDSEEE